ncbi:MAG: DUF2079 domain-containing protein [Candidatus Omnitrophica bacterium]|nr:DUF2079 domain-containing protein [Candidatus Omnitrophota bacterium]
MTLTKVTTKRKRFFLWRDIPALLLLSLYILFFGFVSTSKYESFSYNDFDLAVHAQTLYNILHGSISSSILGVPFLGNHLNLILFLIAPIYAIFRSPVILLLLQTIALGLSGYPIYLIAKEELPKRFSVLVLFSYLFYPCIGYVNLYEFHPTVFATFFISMLLYFMYKDRLRAFFVFVILALLCQENIPLVILPLGLYLLIIKKSFKWWFPTIVIGGIWFWLAAYKLIPLFGKGTIKFIGIYGYLGNNMAEILKNILTHPIQIISIVLRKDNLIYLGQIFGPVLFLPILSPLNFLGALPTLLQHLLSLRETEHTIFYHYTAEIIPFVFFAAIFSLKKSLRLKQFQKNENFLAIGLLVATIGANLILGPHMDCLLNLNRFYKTSIDYVKEAFLKKVPRDAEVIATFEFLPKLSNRRMLYSLHHVAMGTYTLSDIPYELSKTTEYAIVDFEDGLTFKSTFYNNQSGNNLRRVFINADFGIISILETIALFKKGFQSDYFLYKILSAEPDLPNKVSAVINSEIELIGYSVDKHEARKGLISFKFYWRSLKNTDKVYGTFFDILDDRDRLVKQATRFICYRVYPTNEWQEGQIIEEFYRALLPADLSKQGYQIKMGIFDFYTGQVQKVDSDIKNAIDHRMRINLINFGEE